MFVVSVAVFVVVVPGRPAYSKPSCLAVLSSEYFWPFPKLGALTLVCLGAELVAFNLLLFVGLGTQPRGVSQCIVRMYCRGLKNLEILRSHIFNIALVPDASNRPENAIGNYAGLHIMRLCGRAEPRASKSP